MTDEHVEVLIVGAGLSGIGAAYHLQTRAPDRDYLILEERQAMGGTWDLFRYPGVRSDSDMYTLGYGFRPWREAKAIADGPAILDYIQETARAHGIDRRIRHGWRVVRAAWSTPDALWRVEAEGAEGRTLRLTCSFLFLCGGYYSYAGGHAPAFPGRERFKGRIVHPQSWPQDLDYAGQRVVVIGSGATAVTLVPEMAKTAAHVTMLQRSPTYVVSRPAQDRLASRLKRVLPARLAYGLIRWRNVLFQMWIYRLSRRKPEALKARLISLVRGELGAAYDVATHFTPRYNPWDQRLCLVPDADLFEAIRSGGASILTDQIETFTETGLALQSGAKLEADIIVTATGLTLQAFNGVALSVDGRPIEPGQTLGYKGMMYDGVPNLATCFGYTNASWTLKADLTAAYVCRLLNHMRRSGLRQCTPRNGDPAMPRRPWLDFSSGYVVRALETLPKQGDRPPWRLHQNYALDLVSLRFAALEDGVMEFSNAKVQAPGGRTSGRKLRKVIE